LFFLSALFIISLYSCKEDEIVEPDQTDELSFFPLYTGYWIEYKADSIVHRDSDDQNGVDTAINYYHFLIREVVDSSYIDAEGRKSFVIIRYKRDFDTVPWVLSNVWTANIDPYSVQRVEDNIRFIRLKFPISSSTFWNGNALNFFPAEEYSYSNLYSSKRYDDLDFDSTITVIQNDFVSNINRIIKNETYGAGTGLLFKQVDSVRTLNVGGSTIILNGFEYKQQITGYKY
jgi:hypothetical protein